jgi:hypothetical protein
MTLDEACNAPRSDEPVSSPAGASVNELPDLCPAILQEMTEVNHPNGTM